MERNTMNTYMLSVTAGDLVDALRPFAKYAVAAQTDAFAGLFVKQPWRITRAVYGPSATVIWPPQPGMPATAVLADCAERLRVQRDLGRNNHYAFDLFRLEVLMAAEEALLRIIMAPDPAIGIGMYGVIDRRDPRFRANVLEVLDGVALVRFEQPGALHSLMRVRG